MKRFFNLMLVALLATSMICVSCDKPEDDPTNGTENNGGNNGDNGGGQQTADGMTITFNGETWTPQFTNNLWITDYEQMLYDAYKNTEAEIEADNSKMFPATDGYVYPDADAEQDYFCNYYAETAYDISEIFEQPDGSIIVGDYFWFPGFSDAVMTLENINFDAATLMVRDMKVTIPLFKTTEALGQAQDFTTYPEVVTFHNVALESVSLEVKSIAKRNLQKLAIR